MLTFDVSTLYHIYMCMCVNCVDTDCLSVLVLTSQKPKSMLASMQNPNHTFFSLDSSHWMKDKSDIKDVKPVHVYLRDGGSNSDTTVCTWMVTQTPLVPSGPLWQGLTMLPRPSAPGKQFLPCAREQSSSPDEEGREGGQGIWWPSALCEKASSLLCSAARLCRLLSHLFKAVALSL